MRPVRQAHADLDGFRAPCRASTGCWRGGLDGAQRDVELHADLLVGAAACQRSAALAPPARMARGDGLHGPRSARREVLQEAHGDRRRDEASPAAAARYRLDQQGRTGILEQEAARTVGRARGVTYPSRSKCHQTTAYGSVTSGPARSLVASRPSITGMRMSSRHTSGRRRCARRRHRDRRWPHRRRRCRITVEDEAEPRAHHGLVVGDDGAQGRDEVTAAPRAESTRLRGRGLAIEPTAERVGAFGHARETEARTQVGRPAVPATVVLAP